MKLKIRNRFVATLVVCLVPLLLPGKVQAQEFSNKQLKAWSRNPEWIRMMDAPDANYFEVVAAFEAFWKDRELPREEDDRMRAPREELGKSLTARERKRQERKLKKEAKREGRDEWNTEKYAFDVKRYRHWKLTVEPYVQADGRILSKEEQLEIWKNQR